MKLSKIQQHVLDMMRQGWELGVAHSIGSRSCWLQEGFIGECGKSEDVKYSTLSVLCDKGLIEQKGKRHGMMAFQLTKLGIQG